MSRAHCYIELAKGIAVRVATNKSAKPTHEGTPVWFHYLLVGTSYMSGWVSTLTRSEVPSRPPERPAVIHSSLYLREPVHEALRKIAFDERVKIHDLAIEGIDAVLRRRGFPTVQVLKAGKKRRGGGA